MRLEFTPNAWEDFEHWADNDQEIFNKIRDLLRDIKRNPFTGLGKPEPLRFELQGYWSRRITSEHRLVYAIEGKGKQQRCIIMQCRYHY